LVEGQRGIINQPNGRRLGHQRCIAHGKSPLCLAHLFLEAKPMVIGDDGN
jgi:hypothetical protein